MRSEVSVAGKRITAQEVRQLICTWGRLCDEHEPLSAFLPFIAEEGFEIRGLGVVLKGYAGLDQHCEMKRRFFDEKHAYRSFKITCGVNRARAITLMWWEASYREDGAARSVRIKAMIQHSWVIRRSLRTGNPVIVKHVANSFRYVPGFAPPPVPALVAHLSQPGRVGAKRGCDYARCHSPF